MSITRKVRAGILLPAALALVAAGCASGGRRAGLNSRLIRPAQDVSAHEPSPFEAEARTDSLETAMGKIRELSTRARPVSKQVIGPTIESFDQQLAAALAALHAFPIPETHRRVALEYARLGVFDAAHRHYRAALTLNPRDGAAFDGLARLWRDARLPALALGDAQRAVYYLPRLPEPRNTLGTVLQALGQNREAKRAYESVLLVSPDAPYALNNLGYLALLEGNTERAVGYFHAALAAEPLLLAASHNLALAHAVNNRLDLARQALLEAGPAARADYNFGIINLARGNTADARRAFEAACRIDPAQPLACERAATLAPRMGVSGGGTE